MRNVVLLLGACAFSCSLAAQAPAPDSFQPVATMKQLMLEIIHPASNEILLAVNRGGPESDREWASVRRNAVTLAESGNLLMMRNRASDWVEESRSLVAAGSALYKAAEARDSKTLGSLTESLDRSCTSCHKRFRPTVFAPVK